MSDANESKNDSTFLSGLSRKRSYQGIRDSISGSLKKISTNKRPKLDRTNSNKLSSDNSFKYGNYNRYYGYRNENKEEDIRLSVLKGEWFENKSVLDIGSNVGHVSLWIGKNFHPEKIKGVDIDCELVKAARKNIVHYIDENYVSALEQSFEDNDDSVVVDKSISTSSESESVKSSLEDSENLPPQNEEKLLTRIEETSEEITVETETDKVAKEDDTKTDEGNKSNNEIDDKTETGNIENNDDQENENNKDENENEESKSNQTEENKDEIEKTEEEKIESVEETINNDEEIDLKTKDNGKILMERLDRNKRIKKENVFPYNVTFILENYVPAGKQILQYIKEEYDVILCLSVTKWVQLNFGDFGLKLMFKKIFRQLRSGGMLVLEPQPYKSYKRRKNLTPEIRRNYDSMKLMPDQFIEFLLSEEVGFVKCEQIDITPHQKEGFQRPIYLLTKE